MGGHAAQLIAKVGRPQSETPWPGGALSLVFPERSVLDEPAEPAFVVTRKGVIQGGYIVRVVEFPFRCQEVYHRYVDAIDTRFPKIQAKMEHEGMDVDAPGFCQAVMEGRAGGASEWNDPANHARILVTVERGESMLRVAYQSQASRDWSRMINDSSLKKDF